MVEDIAAKAGTVAYTARLHREAVGGFEATAMMELTAAEALVNDGTEALRERLLPPDVALTELPPVNLDAAGVEAFRQGKIVGLAETQEPGLARVYGPGGEQDFLGVGELAGDGTVAPKRVFMLGPKKSPDN
jgi:tRNA pseudouridine55 synthase